MLFELMGILAGIAIFIYSIEQLSDQLLRISKEKLKELMQKFTENPVRGLFTGIIATVILQSSTATTSILISLVDAGLISFSQSLGVIAGSNIGTTITAQLVAFNFMVFAPVFLIIGFLLTFSQKYNIIGKSLFLFGLLFFSLSIISSAAKGLSDDSIIRDVIKSIDNTLIAIIIGLILTLLVNSSSVITALAVLLTMEGLVPISIAIPLVLGSNIGTTATALLVSRKMDIFAKRTAYAHVLFNIAGVLIVFPFIPSFVSFVTQISNSPGATVANAHTIFNILAAVLFLLLSPFFIRVIEFFTPSKEKEILFRPMHIERLSNNTEAALKQIKLELLNHLNIVKEMFDISTEMILYKNADKINQIEKLESLSDYLDSKITSALVNLSNRKLNQKQSKEIIMLSKVANEIERLGDVAHDYGYIQIKLNENNLEFSKESIEEIMRLKFKMDEIFSYLSTNFISLNKRHLGVIQRQRKDIDNLISIAHKSRISVLAKEKYSMYATVLFIDSISAFEESISILNRIAKNLSILS